MAEHSKLVHLWLTGTDFKARKVQEALEHRINNGAARDYQTNEQYKLAAIENVVRQTGFRFDEIAEEDTKQKAVYEGSEGPVVGGYTRDLQDFCKSQSRLLIKQNDVIAGLKSQVDVLLQENGEMRFRLEGLDK